jgi:hypothetical protein
MLGSKIAGVKNCWGQKLLASFSMTCIWWQFHQQHQQGLILQKQ